jgi:hypothetical protein
MAIVLVHQIAKEQGITSKEALEVLRGAGLDVKAGASKVEADDAARAFQNQDLTQLAPYRPQPRRSPARTQRVRKRRPRIVLEDFTAWVEAERPPLLSAAEVARVWPSPWFTRNGSGKRARIRLPLASQKYERMQGDEYWHRVDDWTMGPPR